MTKNQMTKNVVMPLGAFGFLYCHIVGCDIYYHMHCCNAPWGIWFFILSILSYFDEFFIIFACFFRPVFSCFLSSVTTLKILFFKVGFRKKTGAINQLWFRKKDRRITTGRESEAGAQRKRRDLSRIA